MLNEKLKKELLETRHSLVEFHLLMERLCNDHEVKKVVKKQISKFVSSTDEELLSYCLNIVLRKIDDDTIDFTKRRRRV
jgi:hypothetical protein